MGSAGGAKRNQIICHVLRLNFTVDKHSRLFSQQRMIDESGVDHFQDPSTSTKRDRSTRLSYGTTKPPLTHIHLTLSLYSDRSTLVYIYIYIIGDARLGAQRVNCKFGGRCRWWDRASFLRTRKLMSPRWQKRSRRLSQRSPNESLEAPVTALMSKCMTSTSPPYLHAPELLWLFRRGSDELQNASRRRPWNQTRDEEEKASPLAPKWDQK